MSKQHGKDNLFSEFPSTSKEKWIEKVNIDLEGADFSKKLVWRTLEGIEVDPFYTSEDTENLAYLKDFHNLNLNHTNPQEGPRSWIIYEKIMVDGEKKADKEAQRSLHSGGNGIHFIIEKSNIPDFESLLSSVAPNINPIKFTLNGNVFEFLTNYLEAIDNNLSIEKTDIQGGLNYDPLMNYTMNGELDEDEIIALGECIKLTRNINDFRPITINGVHFHNAGADAAQEIAFVLSAAVEYIERFADQGISIEEFLSGFEFSLGVGTNYFMEIAKIKALRVLFHNIITLYKVRNFEPGSIQVHSESSVWTKTIYDPYVNMLRNTTEAMSALLGGCNSLSISAFDEIFNMPSDFSKRISRNISNLLKEESYFDKVSDPSAGSYYIEELTDKLVESGLEIFKELESNGGFIQSFDKGLIKSMIDTSRDKKHDLISKRREIFIGTNQYPNTADTINTDEIKTEFDTSDKDSKFLRTSRGAIQFEKLRLTTDNYIKHHGEDKRPIVFLSLIGEHKVMRKARATFSLGFFGCAGFKVIESSPSPDIFKAVNKAIESNADIVVMCGADDDYLSDGIDYAKAYTSNSKGVLVMAGNPEDKKDELQEAGVYSFINLRTNLIESLRDFQNQLNILNA
jgi:methylmalonyl-CoA mutase